MADEKNTKVIEITTTSDDVIKLTKTYKFDGREIKELDLSGLKDLTMADYEQVRKYLATRGVTPPALLAEADPTLTNAYAAVACHMPFEFFEQLNLPDGYAVKNKVMGFIYSGGSGSET